MNKGNSKTRLTDMDTLDNIIEQILTQASGDDEVFQAFRQLMKDHIKLPADGFVIGEPIVITAIEYTGNARRGLTAGCRLPESDRIITLRAGTVYDYVPGHIVTIHPKKQWRYGGHPYLSGEIESARLDVQALKLLPLDLADRGIWDPRKHDWGREDAHLEDWARSIMDSGPRPMFEMEQVMPGESVRQPGCAVSFR